MAKVTKKTDPKKPMKIIMTKVGKAPDRSKDGVELGFKKGKETRTYEKKDVRTGDPRYGKESMEKDTPGFVKEAQGKKQDIAYKDGKPFRAGTTTVLKEPDKFTTTVKVTPDIRPIKIKMSSSSGLKGEGKVKVKTAMPKKRLPPTVSWLKQQKRHERGH